MLQPASILEKHELKRSYKWPSFRKKIIKERGGVCELSGATSDLEAHHIFPFHLCVLLGRPELELDKRNIIILSGGPINYHLLLGHLNSFQSYNASIMNMQEYGDSTAQEIKTHKEWSLLREYRPKPWDRMTIQEKEELREMLNRKFPFLPHIFSKIPPKE
jgi:hypothetical protein